MKGYIHCFIWIMGIFFLGDLQAQDNKRKPVIQKDKKITSGKNRFLKIGGQKRGTIGAGKKLSNGGVFTPKGNIHALFVFVGIKDSIDAKAGKITFNDQAYKNWNIQEGQELPEYIDSSTGRNDLIYERNEFFLEKEEGNRGISEYYYQMSLGKFRFTGEVLKDPKTKKPVRIDIATKGSQSIQELTYKVMDEMYRRFPNFDWTKFDKRTNYSNYKYENTLTKPDGKPDCIVFIYRSHNGMKHQVFPSHRSGWGGGIATSYLSGYNSPWPGVSFDNAGYTSSNESAKDIEELRSFFLHEMSHKIFSAPHYNGANGEIGDYFFYPSNAYGMMNTSSILNTAANGWERWACGWIDLEDANHQNSAIVSDEQLMGKHEFYLDDFVETGNVIRIKIPYTENQYLWIENHQKESTFDEGLHAGEVLSKGGEKIPYSEKGVYMYVERISERLTDLPRYGKRSDSNGIKLLHAAGNWDYNVDSIGSKDWGNFHNNPIYVFTRDRQNSIGGTNPFMRYLYDFPSKPTSPSSKDGVMKYKNTVHGGYIESVDILKESNGVDTNMLYANFAGRNKEANTTFQRRSPLFQVGDELSLSSTTCLVNMRRYNSKKGLQSAFIPNGITVKIMDGEKRGRVKVSVQFGDFEIRKHTRWAGRISVKPNYMDSLQSSLILAKRVRLLIDKSGTPNSHLKTENNDFIEETNLQLEENAIFVLEEKSKLVIKDNSRLILRKNAKLILKNKAQIVLLDNAQIILEDGAEILFEKGGKIRFKGTAKQIENYIEQ